MRRLMTDRAVARALRERTSHLRALTRSVREFVHWMDAEIQKPSTVERGRRIAQALNALKMANDSARMFALPRKKPRTKAQTKASALTPVGE